MSENTKYTEGQIETRALKNKQMGMNHYDAIQYYKKLGIEFSYNCLKGCCIHGCIRDNCGCDCHK